MRKIVIYIIVALLIIIISITTVIIINRKDDDKEIVIDKDFVYMGLFQERIIDEENYILTDYNNYKNIFSSRELAEDDFKNNNYVVVLIPYDSCSESDIIPTRYDIRGNDIDILVSYKASCGVCAPEYIYYLLPIAKDMISVNVNLNYKAINDPKCDPNIAWKPIIYLYPKEEIEVTVKLGNSNYLTTTYPKYNNSWIITAYPSGKLIDKKTNREYYSLYWEGINHNSKIEEYGFIVKGIDTVEFLEEKLSLLGLTDREAA